MANIAANGSFKLNQADIQGISGYNFGTPTLGPEKGRSLTVGLVFTPQGIEWLRNASLTVDYFNIDIADAINLPGRQYSLDQCYTGDALYCRDITRRPTALGSGSAGAIATIDQHQGNTGGLSRRGIDVTVADAMKLAGGTLAGRLAYTYLISASSIPAPGAVKDPLQGEVGTSRNRWVLNLGYDVGRLAVKTTTTFIGGASLDDQFLSSNDIAPQFGKIGSKTYFDTQLSYALTPQRQLYFGVNNVFNVKPPPIISGLPANVTGSETDAGTYDAIGRRVYLGLRMNF